MAVAGQDGKYGYINRKGEWHLKPKYDKALKFDRKGAVVMKGSRSYSIKTSGKKIKRETSRVYNLCGNGTFRQLDPLEYIVAHGDSYEIAFKYWLITDLETEEELRDTTEIAIDTFFGYSRNAIVLKKEEKYALYKCFPIPSQVLVGRHINSMTQMELEEKHDQIQFVYDDLVFDGMGSNNRYNDAVYLAKVRVGDRWEVINGQGDVLVPIEYLSVDISNPSFALVQFEENKKGYREYNPKDWRNGELSEGKEFFLR